MNMRILFTIATSIALLAAGMFFLVKGIKSRPYKLKKEPLAMIFRKNLPHELYEPLEVVCSSKTELIGVFAWVIIAVFTIFLIIGDNGSILYVLVACGGAFYNFWLANRKILFYENAVVFKTITSTKTCFLDDIDAIISYNIVNAFNRGVSYGYKLVCGEETVMDFPKSSFKNIDCIETLYRHSAYIEEFKVQDN